MKTSEVGEMLSTLVRQRVGGGLGWTNPETAESDGLLVLELRGEPTTVLLSEARRQCFKHGTPAEAELRAFATSIAASMTGRDVEEVDSQAADEQDEKTFSRLEKLHLAGQSNRTTAARVPEATVVEEQTIEIEVESAKRTPGSGDESGSGEPPEDGGSGDGDLPPPKRKRRKGDG